MEKDCKCGISILAIIIIVFSFWQIMASKWIIVVSAALIILAELLYFMKYGCSWTSKFCPGHKTGEEIFVDKNPRPEYPSKKEVEETITKPVKKPISKKVVAKR